MTERREVDDEELPDSLNSLGSGICPVCSEFFVSPGRTLRAEGVALETEVVHEDIRCLDHMAAHDPRELAQVILLMTAQLTMAQALAGEAERPRISRWMEKLKRRGSAGQAAR